MDLSDFSLKSFQLFYYLSNFHFLGNTNKTLTENSWSLKYWKSVWLIWSRIVLTTIQLSGIESRNRVLNKYIFCGFIIFKFKKNCIIRKFRNWIDYTFFTNFYHPTENISHVEINRYVGPFLRFWFKSLRQLLSIKKKLMVFRRRIFENYIFYIFCSISLSLCWFGFTLLIWHFCSDLSTLIECVVPMFRL